MISYRAVPGATSASIAVIFHITILIENTVVVGLFEGVPHAYYIIRAGFDTVFDVRDCERVNEVALTLECPMAIASRAPDIIECKMH